MTLRDLLQLMRRRWYVFAASMLVMGLLAAHFAQDGGTFSTRTVVSFTLPAANVLTPEGGSDNESVIAFASAVATQVNQGRPAPRYSHNDAPFYGAGVREGVLVGLRDEGNQWLSSSGSAVIEVQIVGRTYDWVEDRQAQVLGEIEGVAAAEQNAGIPADQHIRVHVEPLTRRIEHITASRTAQLAAGAAMLGASLLVGGGSAAQIDRMSARRSRPSTRRTHRIATREGKSA